MTFATDFLSFWGVLTLLMLTLAGVMCLFPLTRPVNPNIRQILLSIVTMSFVMMVFRTVTVWILGCIP